MHVKKYRIHSALSCILPKYFLPIRNSVSPAKFAGRRRLLNFAESAKAGETIGIAGIKRATIKIQLVKTPKQTYNRVLTGEEVTI